MEKISKNIEITSQSVLPTNFILHTEHPFDVNPKNFSLMSKKSFVVKVSFDPNFEQDKISKKISKKLFIKHYKHPTQQTIDLVGQMSMPNLEFENKTINFGTVMNDTYKKILIKVSNPSEMTLEYQWLFYLDEQQDEHFKRIGVSINEIFDILPMKGFLTPDSEEHFEFSFYGYPDQKFESLAIC